MKKILTAIHNIAIVCVFPAIFWVMMTWNPLSLRALLGLAVIIIVSWLAGAESEIED